jgi:hypothetical protein
MPATRAARRAAAERQFLELPTDVLGLVLYQLPLAHDIALTGLTCRTLCNAAKLALKLRPYSSEVVTLAGHEQLLLSVAVTPGGLIITGSEDGTQAFAHPASVKVWRDGICVRTIQSNAAVAAVAALPCGSSFLSGTDDQFLRRWSLDGALEWEEDMGVGDAVTSIAVLCDGVHAVVGFGTFTDDDDDKGGAIRLYNVDGTHVHTFTGHISWVDAVAVTPDGQHIISGSVDLLVKVWSVASKSLLSTCAGHTHPVRAVAAMPDGQRILSGSDDTTVRVWLLDGTLENTFELNTGVWALVALPDNQHALFTSQGTEKAVKLLNVNDGAVLRTFRHHIQSVNYLALLPDGLRFVSGSDDKTARIVYHGLAPQK